MPPNLRVVLDSCLSLLRASLSLGDPVCLSPSPPPPLLLPRPYQQLLPRWLWRPQAQLETFLKCRANLTPNPAPLPDFKPFPGAPVAPG